MLFGHEYYLFVFVKRGLNKGPCLQMTLTLKDECAPPPGDVFTHKANTCHTPCQYIYQ